MQYANLGRSGVKVSRLCLGTMNFGTRASEPDSFAIMDAALEAGVNFFDTADVYGGRKYEGYTEQIIGRWLAQGGQRRERIVLATKCHGEMWTGPNGQGLSAMHIRRACEASLRRLRTDRIDLYQMHHVDRSTPWEEIWQAMEQLVREGKVVYVGSSNFAGWHIAAAMHTAEKRHFLGLVSEQSLYNLSDRMVELEVLPACRQYGVGVIPWSPLAGGLLGGMLKGGGMRREDKRKGGLLERHGKQLDQYERLCEQLGQAPAVVGLAWLLHREGVTSPIVGPRTMAQFTESLPAVELKLDGETMKKLDEIWPGPGGEAPEAYAW